MNKDSFRNNFYQTGIGHCNCAVIIFERIKKSLNRTDCTWIALFHIIGFTMESALKSYLHAHGIEKKALKKFGHRLDHLYENAQSFGLEQEGIQRGQPELSKSIGVYINEFGKDYHTFNYRYIENDMSVLNTNEGIDTVLRCLEFLLDMSKPT